MLRFFIYGEVYFTSTQKRDAAGRRLDQRAARAGFTAEAFDVYPAGWVVSTSASGLPGFRFSYYTTDQATAFESMEDISGAWDVLQTADSQSSWGFSATTA